MTESILLYLMLGAAGGCLAYFAQKTNKSICVWLMVACLTLIVGLRAYDVGIDTANYVKIFEKVATDNMGTIYGTEKSFLYIVKGLQFFSKSHTFLFLVFSFLTNALIIFRIWEFKKEISFFWAFVYFFARFYFFSFNIMRQMVAVAIVFWGSRYVQRGKYTLYMLFLFIGALFHQSALLGLMYVVVDVFLKKEFTWEYIWKNALRESKKILIVVICVAVLFGAFLIFKASKYIPHFKEIKLDIGFLVPVKLLFVTAYVLFVRITSGKWGGAENSDACVFFNQHVVIHYSMGLIISLLGYFYPFMDRIGMYFTVFGCLFMGYVIKKAKHPWLVMAAYSIMILIPFGMDLMGGGQGQLPYAFFWQS